MQPTREDNHPVMLTSALTDFAMGMAGGHLPDGKAHSVYLTIMTDVIRNENCIAVKKGTMGTPYYNNVELQQTSDDYKSTSQTMQALFRLF